VWSHLLVSQEESIRVWSHLLVSQEESILVSWRNFMW